MELFKIGKVISRGKNYIIFESNYTGYIVYCADPDEFEKDQRFKLFLYYHRNEYVAMLYGFKTFKERILFDDLISVNGVGPKTAIGLLTQGYQQVVEALANDKINILAKAPMIGIKTAHQLIFELKDKYQYFQQKQKFKYIPSDIITTLKSLGFNERQINFALGKIKSSNNMETMVEEAIKIIANEKSFKTN